MECKFSDFDGKCQMFDPGIEMPGCSEDGKCICEDDEDTTILCEHYEEI